MKSAFTLIELSIVLIIIALIIGGVLTGRELIDQTKIRAQVQQLRDYEAAYNTFKIKYGETAIPGDYNNAANVLSGTTSGDGDGIIESATGTHNYCRVNHDGEQDEFFLQLTTAGLIDGNYDGLWASGPGVGYPELKITEGKGMVVGSKWNNVSNPNYGDNTQILEADDPLRTAVLCLTVGDPDAASFDMSNRTLGIASPERTRALDVKLDDGGAKSGKFFAIRPLTASADCTNSSPYDTYDSTITDATCLGLYILEK